MTDSLKKIHIWQAWPTWPIWPVWTIWPVWPMWHLCTNHVPRRSCYDGDEAEVRYRKRREEKISNKEIEQITSQQEHCQRAFNNTLLYFNRFIDWHPMHEVKCCQILITFCLSNNTRQFIELLLNFVFEILPTLLSTFSGIIAAGYNTEFKRVLNIGICFRILDWVRRLGQDLHGMILQLL